MYAVNLLTFDIRRLFRAPLTRSSRENSFRAHVNIIIRWQSDGDV